MHAVLVAGPAAGREYWVDHHPRVPPELKFVESNPGELAFDPESKQPEMRSTVHTYTLWTFSRDRTIAFYRWLPAGDRRRTAGRSGRTEVL